MIQETYIKLNDEPCEGTSGALTYLTVTLLHLA
jgi:hypothetical protein